MLISSISGLLPADASARAPVIESLLMRWLVRRSSNGFSCTHVCVYTMDSGVIVPHVRRFTLDTNVIFQVCVLMEPSVIFVTSPMQAAM